MNAFSNYSTHAYAQLSIHTYWNVKGQREVSEIIFELWDGLSERRGSWKWWSMLVFWLSEVTRIAQRQVMNHEGIIKRLCEVKKGCFWDTPCWHHIYSTNVDFKSGKTIWLVRGSLSVTNDYTPTTSVVYLSEEVVRPWKASPGDSQEGEKSTGQQDITTVTRWRRRQAYVYRSI